LGVISFERLAAERTEQGLKDVIHRRRFPGVLTAAAVLAAVFVGAAGTAQASVTPFDLHQLTEASQTIVLAQVVSTTSHWTTGPQSTIVTDVGLRVGQVLKGDVGATLRIRLPGGRVGTAAVLVSDAPQLFFGQTYLLFLDAGGNVVDGRVGAPQVRGGDVPALGDSLAGIAARVAQSTGRSPLFLGSLSAAQPAGTLLATTTAAASAATATARVGVPVISSVSPARAAAGVGAKVTITGSGFGITQGLGRVLFFSQSGQPGLDARVVSWSDTSIVCRVPMGSVAGSDAPSSGPLHVTTGDGQTSNDVQFSVIFAFDRSQWAVRDCAYRVDTRFQTRGLAAAVAAATETWDVAGTPFRFVDGGKTSAPAVLRDGYNDITWAGGLPAGYSALTSTYTVGSCIVEADTKLSTSVSWGDGSTNSLTTDLQTIVLHELGHWVGLRDLYGHTDTGKTMYGVRGGGDVFRSLSVADRAGKLWIYGPARWDHTPPSTTLQSAWGTLHGFVRLHFRVLDRRYSCGAAKVSVFIKSGGRLVPWVTFDGVPVGVWQSPRFKCTLSAGTYRFVAVATDMAGNKQVSMTFKTLTVQ
jgi:hypothetical protein